MPPTILYVVTEDWYFWLHRLALGQGALRAGYRVVVAARVVDHGERLRDAGFEVVELPWRRRGGTLIGELATLYQLWRLCRTLRPELVHMIALKPILYAGLAARLASVPRLATVAGLGYVFTSKRLGARLLRLPVVLTLAMALSGRNSRITLENPDDGEVLARAGALRRQQIALVCSCGVDCERFHPAPEPPGEMTIGMACRLLRDKGVDVVIAAIRQIRGEGSDIRFLLAGGIDPGNPDSHTESDIAGWAVEGLVDWIGQVDDIAQFWQRCHIAVYPSRYGEGLPKTLLEAAACARPIVTTNMPGCRDAILPGETGYLIPMDDAAALADRIIELANDQALRQRMGEAGRALTLREFADPVVVARLLSLYPMPAGRA